MAEGSPISTIVSLTEKNGIKGLKTNKFAGFCD
jgi:hypothetical protein